MIIGRPRTRERNAMLDELGQTWVNDFLPHLRAHDMRCPPMLQEGSRTKKVFFPKYQGHMDVPLEIPRQRKRPHRHSSTIPRRRKENVDWETFFCTKPHVLGRYSAEPYMPFRELRNVQPLTLQKVQGLPQERKKQSWLTHAKQEFGVPDMDWVINRELKPEPYFSGYANQAILKNVKLHARGH
eukprot:TRINITY_DN10781_c0_g1_i1.p1 TRINITY_DN10781_c0_g1~~TRINITY_DN10781_c0_g1_i1.p1  ORF type:complete len:184 (+),score=15.61 TRINITY_DN10781_c0_g1_i1:229-780(+)